jgi:hypothetical protein
MNCEIMQLMDRKLENNIVAQKYVKDLRFPICVNIKHNTAFSVWETCKYIWNYNVY